MANCETIQVELSAYLDGEVAPADRAALEAHLRECAACRDALQDLECARNALAELPRLKAPKSLAAAIKRNLNGENSAALPAGLQASRPAAANVVTFEPRPQRSAWRPALLGIAAMLMAAVLIFLLLPLLTKDSISRTASAPAVQSPKAAPALEQKDIASHRANTAPAAAAPEPQVPANMPQETAGEVAAQEKTLSEARKRELAEAKPQQPAKPESYARPAIVPPSAPAPTGGDAAPAEAKAAQKSEKMLEDEDRDDRLGAAQMQGAQRDLKNTDQLKKSAEAKKPGQLDEPLKLKDMAAVEEIRRETERDGAKHKATAAQKPGAMANGSKATERPSDEGSEAGSPAANSATAGQPGAGIGQGRSNSGAKAPARMAKADEEGTDMPQASRKPAAKAERLDKQGDTVAQAPGAPPAPPATSAPPPPSLALTPKPAEPAAVAPATPSRSEGLVRSAPRAPVPENSGGAVANNQIRSGQPLSEAGGDGGDEGAALEDKKPSEASRLEAPPQDGSFGGVRGGGRQRIVCREAELAGVIEKLERLAESAGGNLKVAPDVSKDAKDDLAVKRGYANDEKADPAARKRARTVEVVMVINEAERATVRQHLAELASSYNPAKGKAADNGESAGKDLDASGSADKNSANKKDSRAATLHGESAKEEQLEAPKSAPQPDSAKVQSLTTRSAQSTITIEILAVP